MQLTFNPSQFGQFVFVNILLSLISSFTLFVALLLLWGTIAILQLSSDLALLTITSAGPRGFQGTIKLLVPKHILEAR